MKTRLIFILAFMFSGLAIADPLLGLPALSIPVDNKQSTNKIQLGKLLFNDARFSGNDSISCASCHQAEKAFTDGLKTPLGINGLTGARNAPTLVNTAFYERFFIDGRAKSLEDQALDPLLNPVEHGLSDYKKIINIVQTDSNYQKRFQQVFDISAEQININHVAKAIASFERTLIAGNSAFDQYYFGRDHSQLSDSAARGLRLFRRKGNCANCHEISWNAALFTDNRFYNIGVGFKRLKPIENKLISSIQKNGKINNLALTKKQHSELGLFNISHSMKDMGKFKTPTLRNISLTAPYMHDGSMNTLEEVIDYYDKGGEPNKFLDPAIFPLHFSKQEKTDLVEFLKSLNSLPLSQ